MAIASEARCLSKELPLTGLVFFLFFLVFVLTTYFLASVSGHDKCASFLPLLVRKQQSPPLPYLDESLLSTSHQGLKRVSVLLELVVSPLPLWMFILKTFITGSPCSL